MNPIWKQIVREVAKKVQDYGRLKSIVANETSQTNSGGLAFKFNDCRIAYFETWLNNLRKVELKITVMKVKLLYFFPKPQQTVSSSEAWFKSKCTEFLTETRRESLGKVFTPFADVKYPENCSQLQYRLNIAREMALQTLVDLYRKFWDLKYPSVPATDNTAALLSVMDKFTEKWPSPATAAKQLADATKKYTPERDSSSFVLSVVHKLK